MTDLERRAMLGDTEAQRECTEKGIALGCPICGTPLGLDTKIDFLFHVPNGCALSGVAINNIQSSIQRWNTRPAPPIGRCGECKHSTNPAALTMIYGEPGTLTCHHGPCNRRNVNENDFCSYFEPKED